MRVMKSLRSKVTPTLRTIRLKRRRRALKQAVNMWLKKSERTLRKVRAAIKVKKITERLRVKATLLEWLKESKFIAKIT